MRVPLFLFLICVLSLIYAAYYFDSQEVHYKLNKIQPAEKICDDTSKVCDFWFKENERLSILISEMQNRPYVLIHQNGKTYKAYEIEKVELRPIELPKKKRHHE